MNYVHAITIAIGVCFILAMVVAGLIIVLLTERKR